jgi:anaerobic sulfite reductase subunit B
MAMPRAAEPGPFRPSLYRVAGRRQEASDVVTLVLAPLDGQPPAFQPGQFNMLTAFGRGESAISVSGGGSGAIEHTIRAVGAVTRALCAMPVGATVGLRGPFGTDWGADALAGADVVAVAGGIGLAPLRGALDLLVMRLGRPGGPRRVVLLVGGRTPDQIIFGDDLRRWAAAGAVVETSVDVAAPGWLGHVGVVTTLLPEAPFDPARTVALVCGPEVMMRFTARGLLERGVNPASIRISLERGMQCGIGLCGHCQLGPLLVCRDGPVVPYTDGLAALLAVKER